MCHSFADTSMSSQTSTLAQNLLPPNNKTRHELSFTKWPQIELTAPSLGLAKHRFAQDAGRCCWKMGKFEMVFEDCLPDEKHICKHKYTQHVCTHSMKSLWHSARRRRCRWWPEESFKKLLICLNRQPIMIWCPHNRPTSSCVMDTLRARDDHAAISISTDLVNASNWKEFLLLLITF